MPLPFVSRGRFDDAQKQIAKLEKDVERLTDRIAVLTGQQPLYAPAVVAPAAESRKDEADGKPMGRKLTSRDLIKLAEDAARNKKLGPVAVGVAGMGNVKHG